MATTFQGPIRSEGGFKSITKNADTGAIWNDGGTLSVSAS